MVDSYGDAALAWIQKLPELTKIIAEKWHLTNVIPMKNLSYNYVFKAYQTTTAQPVVVKISYKFKTLEQEIKALQAFDGHGFCKLFDIDTTHHALLIECLEPGTELTSLFPDNDDRATIIAIELMKKIHTVQVPTHHTIKSIEEWLELLFTLKTTAIPAHHLEKAQKLSRKLLAAPSKQVILHGDLHHANILLGKDGWTAIDPHGVIGEAAWECEPLIKNPTEKLWKMENPIPIVKRRLALASEQLNIDHQKLLEHCYVRTVLSSCWTVENKPNGHYDTNWLMIEANAFEAMLKK